MTMAASDDSRASQAHAGLKKGELGLVSVILQGVAHVAPAIAILFTIQTNVGFAGLAAPTTYLVAALIVLALGAVLTQLAKHLPSAGGYYTYVSRTVHPRAGFLISWLWMLYSPIFVGVILAAVGSIIENELQSQYGITFPWWVFLLLTAALLWYLAMRGVEESVRIMVVTTVVEMGVVGALSIWGIFSSGEGGVSLAPLNPANATDVNGFYLAVVFSIFAFTGWETAGTLSEESRDPQRNIPRAIIGAGVILGVFLTVTAWGFMIGWGTGSTDTLVASSELPAFTLAHRYWGPLWILILLALVNSAVAGSIAYINAATRMWYKMGRTGSLPQAFGVVSKQGTPVNAIAFEMVLTTTVALVMGLWIGPFDEFVFFGLALVFALVPIYIAGNLGCFLFYRRERRNEFRPWLHAVLPLLTSLALLWVGYKSLIPLPTGTNKWAPVLALVWFVLGIAVLVVMRLRGREEWLLRAGEVVAEAEAA